MAGKNTAAFGIYPDRRSVEMAVETLKANGYRNTDISVLFPETPGTKAPEGATTEAGTDAVVEGAMGWLAGVGSTVGGIVGALVGMGIPEYEAKQYEDRIKSGGILLSVRCDNSEWTKRAKQLLENTDAEDVSSTGESEADFSKSDRPMLRSDASAVPRLKKAS
jgi:hypothetical protein